MNNIAHKSVLLHETIGGLDIREGDIVIDGTLGGGGHSEEAIKMTEGKITLIAIDLDADALSRAEKRLRPYEEKLKAKIFYREGSYRNMDKVAGELGFKNVNKIILDLGLSSDQLESSGRGFTFQKSEPLQMTFSRSPVKDDRSFSAFEIVNDFEEENLADIIYGYGEEKFARRIAKAIVEERQKAPIKDTAELASLIKSSVPFWYRNGRIHPATKTFQALRIAVNDELGALKEGLAKGLDLLAPSGRMAIISFHSLEDRIVKNFIKDMVSIGKAENFAKKPIVPAEGEIKDNPRSRSSKLRIIIKK